MNFRLRLLRIRLWEVDISSKIQLTILEAQNLNLMKNNKLIKVKLFVTKNMTQ